MQITYIKSQVKTKEKKKPFSLFEQTKIKPFLLLKEDAVELAFLLLLLLYI